VVRLKCEILLALAWVPAVPNPELDLEGSLLSTPSKTTSSPLNTHLTYSLSNIFPLGTQEDESGAWARVHRVFIESVPIPGMGVERRRGLGWVGGGAVYLSIYVSPEQGGTILSHL
jgi:hypothetical protein